MKIVEIMMDRQRHLKFGMNSMIELEKSLGRSITSIQDTSFSMEDLRTFLFIGLKWEDKSLTPSQVGDLMDVAIEKEGMTYLSEKLGEAITGAFGGVGVGSTPMPT